MNNISKTITALLLMLSALALQAQPITWATDVAPILYDNCVKCHRDDGIGHFSLIGYDNAFSRREAIRYKTSTRQMPPWMPDPSYRHFTGENRLTDAEIQTIADWVEAEGPAGDLALAPPAPVFPTGSAIGTPDQILYTPFYTVTATEDEYRCFVLPSGLTQEAFLRGVEILPGNHEMVHHVLIYEDMTGEGQALDAQTPEPGYVNFGGPGVSGAKLVGGWAPGSEIKLYPANMGVRLQAGADLIVQVHYPAGVEGMSGQTTVNLFFTPTTQGVREVHLAPLLNHTPLSLDNGPLYIPANTVKTFHEKYTSWAAGSLLGVGPHMHLIGRSITCFARTLQGDTIPLIRIPEWDFHWQGTYAFQKLVKIPLGTVLHAYATYDNTPANPHNPNDPPQDVALGEATTDEMMLVYFAYLAYQPGDENIILDSTLLSTAVPNPLGDGGALAGINLFPNPADSRLTVEYALNETTDIRIAVVDLLGRTIRPAAEKRDLAPGIYRENVDVAGLSPGLYFLCIQTGATSQINKFLIR